MSTLRTTIFLTCFFLVLPFAVRAGEEKAKKPLDVPALTEKLKVKDDLVRRSALAALGRAGKDAKSAVPAVTDLLKDKNPIVRIYAASALRRIDPQTKLALPVLLDALRVKDETVRCYAAVAFDGYDPTAVPALIDLFRDKDRDTHRWASGAIVGIGKKAEPYLLKARDIGECWTEEVMAGLSRLLMLAGAPLLVDRGTATVSHQSLLSPTPVDAPLPSVL